MGMTLHATFGHSAGRFSVSSGFAGALEISAERQLCIYAGFEQCCFLKGAVCVKKKNVIGHMTVPRERSASWLRRTHLIPRVICLLLAVVIWLAVVNLTDGAQAWADHSESVAGALTE